MKILANDGFPQEVADQFFQNSDIELITHKVAQNQLATFIEENSIDGLLVKNSTKVDKKLLNECPSLKFIGKLGNELDNIDADAVIERGIYLFHTPNAIARSVAELVFAHFFTLSRFLHDSNRMMPLEGDTIFATLKKSYADAYELEGKTLGVIGGDATAQEVLKIGISLGMRVVYFDSEKKNISLEIAFYDGQKLQFNLESEALLEDVLRKAKFVSIHERKQNTYIIDAAEIEKMQNGAFLVNAGAAGTVNEVALVEALDENKLAGAALDVFEKGTQPELPILMNTSMSLSPNLGSYTHDADQKMAKEMAELILKNTK